MPATDTNLTPASAAPQAYQFEAIGFMENRSDFERLVSETSDAMAESLFAALAAKFAEHGFTALEEVYITEDDEQGDTEVKYFVCVRMVGHSRIVENERPSNELADLMTGVTASVCCTSDGTWLLHPEDWELASIDDPEDPAG